MCSKETNTRFLTLFFAKLNLDEIFGPPEQLAVENDAWDAPAVGFTRVVPSPKPPKAVSQHNKSGATLGIAFLMA
jgi:carbamate kinase